MKKWKCLLSELKWKKNFLKLYIVTRWLSLNKKDFIFLAGTGCHGNIGDLAIVLAEYEILSFLYPDKKIIEITSNLLKKHTEKFSKIIGEHVIFVQGGGFIGTLWREEDLMAKKVIQTFPDNFIVIFPQTVYFDSSDYGRMIYKETSEIYREHKKLLLCLRERMSYEVAKGMVDSRKILLLPDVVTCLKTKYKPKKERKGILFCLREDKEKQIDKEKLERIKKCLIEFFGNELEIIRTDMILYQRFNIKKRKLHVQQKMEEFSGAKLIVTDRLHGMVFSALTNTPCIVMDNCNYKVRGVYEWIKQYTNILYVPALEDVSCDDIKKIMGNVRLYNADLYLDKFRELIKYVEFEDVENV